MSKVMPLKQLIKAARDGDLAVLDEFIASGGDVRRETDNSDNAIVIAAERGRTEFVRRLLDAGADPRAKDKYGSPLLSAAAQFGSVDVVRLLLDRNPNLRYVNATDKVKETALHVAARRGHPDVVELLLQRRAKVNLQNTRGTTPLINAIQSSARQGEEAAYFAVVQLLIAHGADVTLDNDEGDTPLHLAAGRNRPDLVQLLVDAGAPVNLEAGANGNGKTPLHYAIERYATDSIEVLSAVGADMNALVGTSTPFHFAFQVISAGDKAAVIAQLALHGTDPDVPCTYAGFPNFREFVKGRPEFAKALDAGLAKRAMARIVAGAKQRHLPNPAV